MNESTGMNFNPYTPIGAASNQPLPSKPPSPRTIGTATVCFSTLAACTAAGALFGFAAALLIMLAQLASQSMGNDMGGPWGMGFAGLAFLAVYGVIGGGILAFFSSVPSVLLVLVAGPAIWRRDHRWHPGAIKRFATFSGLLAGFLPITVLSEFDLRGAAFSVIPALFGAVVARLLISSLARSAGQTSGQNAEPLPSQHDGNYASEDPLAI